MTVKAAARWLLALTVFGPAVAAAPAAAQALQPGRMAIEGVVAVATSSRAADDPFVFLDLATTVRITDELDVIVRPYARRLPGGDWDALLYQAQIRYQPFARVRLEAGIMSSPLGLGTLELRQDLNPAINSPFYYFATLPVFDSQSDRVQVLSGGYPIGAIASVSGSWWDARGGVIDGTPARYRKIFQVDGPSAAAQLVAGGGVTPRAGLRFGAGFAHGPYRLAADQDYYGVTDPYRLRDADATVFNLEGEYQVGYTRLSGEWVRDRFESSTRPAIARGFYLQAVQTLSPRLFATSRLTHASAPALMGSGRTRWSRSSLELSAGYRLSPDWTLKGGYEAARRFGVDSWTHAALASVVWSKRWF